MGALENGPTGNKGVKVPRPGGGNKVEKRGGTGSPRRSRHPVRRLWRQGRKRNNENGGKRHWRESLGVLAIKEKQITESYTVNNKWESEDGKPGRGDRVVELPSGAREEKSVNKGAGTRIGLWSRVEKEGGGGGGRLVTKSLERVQFKDRNVSGISTRRGLTFLKSW